MKPEIYVLFVILAIVICWGMAVVIKDLSTPLGESDTKVWRTDWEDLKSGQIIEIKRKENRVTVKAVCYFINKDRLTIGVANEKGSGSFRTLGITNCKFRRV